VKAKLNNGSDRTSGASINTGTDTRNTAVANTNLQSVEFNCPDRETDKETREEVLSFSLVINELELSRVCTEEVELV
jgi:hypothetical protein